MDARVILCALCLCAVPIAATAQPTATVEQLCRRLTAHEPDADVAYHSGKDVYYRDVAPADLDDGNGRIELNDTLTVGIGLYQAQQLNLPVNTPFSPDLYLGEAQIMKDGGVTFNGKRLSQPQIQVLCEPKFRQKP